jgi:ABC-type lipoprotein export system ATPase subunit
MSIVKCEEISKSFRSGTTAQIVLKRVTIALRKGEACVLLGPSGSGKTTLLSIIGCMLSPSTGTLEIDGQLVKHNSKAHLCELRRRYIGFVFQHAQLLPFLTVEDNLLVTARNAGSAGKPLNERMREMLDRLEILSHSRKKPDQLSGGQRQRVAIARAILHRPPVVLADEPTAALDWENGERVVKLLTAMTRSEGAALITVTHDTRLVPMFDRVLRIDGGELREGAA